MPAIVSAPVPAPHVVTPVVARITPVHVVAPVVTVAHVPPVVTVAHAAPAIAPARVAQIHIAPAIAPLRVAPAHRAGAGCSGTGRAGGRLRARRPAGCRARSARADGPCGHRQGPVRGRRSPHLGPAGRRRCGPPCRAGPRAAPSTKRRPRYPPREYQAPQAREYQAPAPREYSEAPVQRGVCRPGSPPVRSPGRRRVVRRAPSGASSGRRTRRAGLCRTAGRWRRRPPNVRPQAASRNASRGSAPRGALPSHLTPGRAGFLAEQPCEPCGRRAAGGENSSEEISSCVSCNAPLWRRSLLSFPLPRGRCAVTAPQSVTKDDCSARIYEPNYPTWCGDAGQAAREMRVKPTTDPEFLHGVMKANIPTVRTRRTRSSIRHCGRRPSSAPAAGGTTAQRADEGRRRLSQDATPAKSWSQDLINFQRTPGYMATGPVRRRRRRCIGRTPAASDKDAVALISAIKAHQSSAAAASPDALPSTLSAPAHRARRTLRCRRGDG